MNIFSIELTLPEIQTLRQSLDVITIAGKDAQFLALLQIKLDSEIQQIANMQSAPQPKRSGQTEKKSQ